MTAQKHGNQNFDEGAAFVAASATSSGPVTKSDSTVLQFRALRVGGAGDVVYKHTETGDALTWPSALAGEIIPVQGVRVMAATTATNIVWMDW